MKKSVLLVVFLLLAVALGFAQETAEQKPAAEQPAAQEKAEPALPPANDIALGKIRFPRNFLQAGKEYARGVYPVVLAQREGVYFFDVANPKGEALFSEMAVIKEYRTGGRFKYRLRRDLTSQGSYFRIKVIMPDKLVMAYFQVAGATPAPAPAAQEPPPAEPK